jgi:hypothetical protein
MMDFYDLTRSGTAPEASKAKGNQVAGSTFSARPKTRSVDNDVQDFNIELRTNKPSYQQQTYDDDGNYYGGAEFGHNEDLLQQAIESFQADLEDWSGRKDYDAAASNQPSRQVATSSGRRGSGRKTTHSSAVSAYMQNVPQIVLQTSRKAPKSQTSSPRAQREPKPDLRADIRAVYGADSLDRAAPSQRPKSQKPHSQTSGNTSKISDEAIPTVPSRDADVYDTSGYEQADYGESTREAPRSAGGATRSTSASRLRANVSNSQNTPGVGTANAPPTGTVVKPFSVRKAAPSTSVGVVPSGQQPRPAVVPRPFSHTESRPTTTSSHGSAVSARSGGSLETPTSSSSSKRVVRKAPVSAVNSLLKSSLAPHLKARSGSPGQDEADVDPSDDRNMHAVSGYDYGKYGAGGGSGSSGPSAMEAFVKQRASTAGAKASSSQKVASANHGSAGMGPGVSYSQSAGTAGNGLTGTTKPTSAAEYSVSPAGSAQKTRPPREGNHSNRGYSKSPTMLHSDGLGLARPDSDAALVDFIQDSDIAEESFEESPILAAYLQQKSHAAHKPPLQHHHHAAHGQHVSSPGQQQQSHAQSDGGEGPHDGAIRPQSRKLYLGADKESGGADSPNKKSYKTAPRSAGARYAAPDSPAAMAGAGGTSATAGAGGTETVGVGLRKMSSFSELMPSARKWNEPSQLPDLRPPSRQSSAFPVHLADEPPTSAPSTGRTIDATSTVVMTKNPKVNSPTNRVATTSSSAGSRPVPDKGSSMRWSRDGPDDDSYEPEEEIPADVDSASHRDCEVESYPASEIDTPRGPRTPGMGMVGGAAAISSALYAAVGANSGANSVHTSLSITAGSSMGSPAGNSVSSSAAAGVSGAVSNSCAGGVVPTRDHIGIGRSAHAHAEPNAEDAIPTYELQRPPSRQKFAAPQHLFEGMPPPTRVGTEKENVRGSKVGGDVRRAQAASPAQLDDGTSPRSGTARAVAPKYNPRDDGFADLGVGEEPFVIKLNSSDSPEKSGGDDYDAMQGHHARAHRRSYNSLTAGTGGQASHSRSSSNASNNWEHNFVEPEAMLSPLGYRPQTVAHSGGVKTPRLLGVYPNSNNNSAANAPAPTQSRGKTASDALRPQAPSGPVRREATNFLMMNQQPHAPLQQAPTASGGAHSRSAGYTVRESRAASEYTAGPPAGRGHNSGGWTDSEPVRASRNQVIALYHCFGFAIPFSYHDPPKPHVT